MKKRNRIWIIQFLIIGLFILLSYSCKKEETKPVPVLTTIAVSDITTTTATSGGNISTDGGFAITVRGVCWSTTKNPTIEDLHTNDGSSVGVFTSSIVGLNPNTSYYLRAYATNSEGTAYGKQVVFTTNAAVLPTVITTAVNRIKSTTANSGGNITSDGGVPITARGVCWGTSTNPVITGNYSIDGTGTGDFTSIINGMTENTTYFARAYAKNSAGTAYGNEISFTTTILVVDYDGNNYNTVQIGTQLWMAENLKTTHYRDGSSIPNITDNNAWASLNTGSYSWYSNDISYKNTYGALYNFYAVVDSRNLCPTGWHVPTNSEMNILVNFLGGISVAGGALKEEGFAHWYSPNSGASNSSGFTALPSGARNYGNGQFLGIGSDCCLWSVPEIDATYAWSYIMNNNHIDVIRYSDDKNDGYSVRCLKD